MSQQYNSIDHILSVTDRVPFSNADTKSLIDYIKMSRGKGYDIALHPIFEEESQEALSEGVMLLTSLSLDTDFLFLNINGGKGLLGGQKRSILTYIGTTKNDKFTGGKASRSLLIALSSINNIYRNESAQRDQ